MPWARFGDDAATYPRLLQIAGFPGAGGSAINEVFGFLGRCATQSANHLTDYVVDFGTAHMIGGARTRKLIGWCVRAGLLTPIEVDGLEQWIIINDPDFIHIRTKAEVEADRARRADAGNTQVTVPVRRRDGDNCRYCGVFVHWTGAPSNRSAELDHLVPGQRATVATLVVACRSCNGGRQDNPDWDDTHTRRPPPAHPNYGKNTAAFLTKNGVPTEPNTEPDARRARATDTAAPAPAAPDTAPAVARPGARAGARTADAEPARELDSNPDSGSLETGSPGSGRDGTGLVREAPASGGTRRRPRRGSRGRGGARDRPPVRPPEQPPDQSSDQPPELDCCANPYPQRDPDTGTQVCLTCEHEEIPR